VIYTHVFFTEKELEDLVREDVPYLDLTSFMLNLSGEGEITYVSREEGIICGTEEVLKIFEMFKIEPLFYLPSGTQVKYGEVFLKGKGNVLNLHTIWKVTQVFLEYASGIATKTNKIVELAKEKNSKVCIATTRKHFPGTKKLSIKAILCGGAVPHRLGISETILVFKEHLNFLGGYEEFFKNLENFKNKFPEKKIVLEVKSMELALKALEFPLDILQLDKFSPEEVEAIVKKARKINPQIKIIAAGGINENNIQEFAKTGVDIIVLSCVYFAKPFDVKVELIPV